MPHDFQSDLDLIASIPAIPSILDVVCQSTGMGFAVVARVTEGRWIACSTRDDIGFGLQAGGELKVETIICHEIRQDPCAVIIEHVAEDPLYRDHSTPKMYGLESYISFPIILSDGSFFGTLCAIDTRPRTLKTEQIIGTFKLFADLIAFHLDASRKLAESARLLEEKRDWERQQRILQRELTHRMKNTLAMVQAVVTQTLRNATSLEDAAKRAGERIMALSRAQDMLTETNWEAANIRGIVEAAIRPHFDGGHRFTVEGPAGNLTAQQGMGLALAIHELATNATKYGALSNGTGHVTIRWSINRDAIFVFEWVEQGGPPVQAPTGKGFGSRLTGRVVPSYFNGRAELVFETEGVHYRLEGHL